MGFSLNKVTKAVTKAVKQVAPVAVTAGTAYLTGGSSLAAGGVGSAVSNYLGEKGLSSGLSGLLGGVVQGAVGLGQDYLTAQQQLAQNQQIAQMELNTNRLLADEAYQRNVAMWNLQNAYNTPEAQMARLKQAGLNPNLVYGGGNVSGNTAGSAPTYNSPEYKLGLIDSYQKIENQAIQNEVARQQLWNMRVDTNLKSAMNNSVIQLNNAKKSLTEAVTRGHMMDNAGYKRILNNMLGNILGMFESGTGGETAELF